MNHAPVTVVYVLGTARSGSTLLTRLLAEAGQDRVFAAGEIRLLWRELDRRVCGCGEPAVDCPVWSRIVGGPGTRTQRARVVTDLMARAARMQDLPRILLADGRWSALPANARHYAACLGETYHRIAETTGARVIVDSSKSVSEAALLASVRDIRPVIVHIVRDPRAVAYSWDRALRRGAEGTPDHPRWSLALRWMLTNAASEAVVRRYPDASHQVRYEDLVRSPATQLMQLDRLIGPGALAVSTDGPSGAVPVGSRHIVGGNRLRRADDPIHVRPDEEWRTRMPRAATVQVAGLTFPLRRRYHYPWRQPT